MISIKNRAEEIIYNELFTNNNMKIYLKFNKNHLDKAKSDC